VKPRGQRCGAWLRERLSAPSTRCGDSSRLRDAIAEAPRGGRAVATRCAKAATTRPRVAWIDGGATSLANLLSLCRRHHRFVHEHGYRVLIARDGGPRFFRSDGKPVPLADETPRTLLGSGAPAPGTMPDADALAGLRAAHAARSAGAA